MWLGVSRLLPQDHWPPVHELEGAGVENRVWTAVDSSPGDDFSETVQSIWNICLGAVAGESIVCIQQHTPIIKLGT